MKNALFKKYSKSNFKLSTIKQTLFDFGKIQVDLAYTISFRVTEQMQHVTCDVNMKRESSATFLKRTDYLVRLSNCTNLQKL